MQLRSSQSLYLFPSEDISNHIVYKGDLICVISLCAHRQQSEEGEKNGSEDDDEEKPGKRVMVPRKKFVWDDKLRSVSLRKEVHFFIKVHNVHNHFSLCSDGVFG